MSNTSEALDCLGGWNRFARTPLLTEHLRMLITHLSRAQIFKVPANGIVLPSELRPGTPVADLLDRYDVPLRLPYGEIAIEFSHTMDKSKAADTGEPWTRCVCVASDMRESGVLQALARAHLASHALSVSEGFVITSVYYHPELRLWIPNNYGIVVGVGRFLFVMPLTEFATKNDPERGAQDLAIELQATVMLITALACSNVSSIRVEPSEALNKKRARNGKSPIRLHHVLVIGGDKSARKEGAAGSHASPRVHLRRGHIRRLEGKNIWVNACVVGDKSRGVVTKDYALRAAA